MDDDNCKNILNYVNHDNDEDTHISSSFSLLPSNPMGSKCIDETTIFLTQSTLGLRPGAIDTRMPPSTTATTARPPHDDDAAITNNNNVQLAYNTLTTLQQNDQPLELTLCIKNVHTILANHNKEIPAEFISEMIHYLTLFYNLLQLGLRTPKPTLYFEQPRIYRQLEYFSCILWRMMTCACTVYLSSQRVRILEEALLESMDSDANTFWHSAASRPYSFFMDCETFMDALKTYLVSSGSYVKLDESLRQELMYYLGKWFKNHDSCSIWNVLFADILVFLDPGDSGIVTIFKFMPFATFFRPFRDCVSNVSSPFVPSLSL
jgi:hypothetical protein